MEIRIGVQHVAREIVIESDLSAAAISKAVGASWAVGSVLELTDNKGRKVIVPSAAIAYVEIGTEEKRRVGFSG